ncbi:YdjC-like protein-domain-containing protein, partial [Baffinella frigidus]
MTKHTEPGGTLLLIVTADDLGMVPERDEGIFQAKAAGVVTSASLLVTGSTAAGAARRAAEVGLSLGLHLNLTEGPPVSCPEDVPSLLCSQRSWWPRQDGRQVEGDVAEMRGKMGLREALARDELFRPVPTAIPYFARLAPPPPGPSQADAGVRMVRIPEEDPACFAHAPEAQRAFLSLVASQARTARRAYEREGMTSPEHFLGLGLMGANCSAERLSTRLHTALSSVSGGAWEGEDEGRAAANATQIKSENGCPAANTTQTAENMGHDARAGTVQVGEYMVHVGLPSKEGDDFSKSEDRRGELETLCGPEVRALFFPPANTNNVEGLARVILVDPSTALARLSEHRSNGTSETSANRNREDPSQEDAGSCRAGVGDAALNRSVGQADPEAGNGWGEGGGGEGGTGGVLLMLSSMTPATGNYTTVLRFESIAKGLGWRTVMRDVDTLPDAAATRAMMEAEGVTGVVGLHAYRAGRLLIGCDVPYVIILAGTDVNVNAKIAKECATMQEAVSGAVTLLAFSSEQQTAFLRSLSFSGPTDIMPQAVALPSQTRTDIWRKLQSAGLPEGANVFVLPCGVREVKDPLFLVEAFGKWHSEDARVWLLVIGPPLEKGTIDALRAAIRLTAGVEGGGSSGG